MMMMGHYFVAVSLFLSPVNCFLVGQRRAVAVRRRACRCLPHVWVEEAEEGFVDNIENLEEGEVLVKAVKAFCSIDDDDDEMFLCAGALVQRPSMSICDAWTADSQDGIPNLQMQGAVKVLDDLFLHHLKFNDADPVAALRNFVLQCGNSPGDGEASYMAGQLRGFRRLKEMVKIDSIYTKEYYDNDDNTSSAFDDDMVFDYNQGNRIYQQVAMTEDWDVAAEIWSYLPNAETIAEHMIVKELEQDP